jgi:hypothetical protein
VPGMRGLLSGRYAVLSSMDDRPSKTVLSYSVLDVSSRRRCAFAAMAG